MRTERVRTLLSYGAGVALFSWFIFLIRGGLSSWFSGDDLMNLQYYRSHHWAALIKANLLFWSSYYRPGGGLFYLSTYTLWGFHPLPFRITALILLYINFGLLALVVRQLTGSRWAALAALLLFGIHPAFAAAYFDTGAIYDVLAYTLFWAAMASYIRIRKTGRVPGFGSLIVLLCLFAAALNSKEVSVTLPVSVALYELVWRPPTKWGLRRLWRWMRHEGLFATMGAIFDIAFIAGKRYGPDSLWADQAYRPAYSLSAYVQSLTHYVRELIVPVPISSWEAIALLFAMAAIAGLSRRRSLIWGLSFIMLGILPLAFIPGRGGFAYLVPAVGWAVYCGGFLDWLVAAITAEHARFQVFARVLLLVLLVAALAPWQQRWIASRERGFHQIQERYLHYNNQIHALIPALPKGARIILLADADGIDSYDVPFLIRLSYGDPTLSVERMTVWTDHVVRLDGIQYDYALDWAKGGFRLYSPSAVATPDEKLGTVLPGKYDDRDRSIVYRGGWIRDDRFPQAYAHTLVYSNVPGSRVLLRFRGSTVKYLFTMAANRGEADIRIDGAHKMTVDLYSPETLWQSQRSITGLGPGEHTLVLTVLPSANRKAADRFVDVDAFEVQE